MTTTYTPRTDSLAHSVCAYFKRLPDEELSIKDICTKWDADAKNVAHQLAQAVSAGLLTKSGTVYSAGPNIASIDLTPAANSQQPRFPLVGRTAPKRGQIDQHIDVTPEQIAALPVRTGTLPRRATAAASKWDALFARITQAGQVVEFPADWKTAVGAQAVKLNRKQPRADGLKWACRLINSTTAGLALEKA